MIEKKMSPKGKSVRVTFELPGEVADNSVYIVGSFNDWSEEADPMDFVKSRKVWKKTLSFKPGEKVEFRNRIDKNGWLNEDEAD